MDSCGCEPKTEFQKIQCWWTSPQQRAMSTMPTNISSTLPQAEMPRYCRIDYCSFWWHGAGDAVGSVDGVDGVGIYVLTFPFTAAASVALHKQKSSTGANATQHAACVVVVVVVVVVVECCCSACFVFAIRDHRPPLSRWCVILSFPWSVSIAVVLYQTNRRNWWPLFGHFGEEKDGKFYH